MEVVFIRYRKLLTILCIVLLIYLPFDVYRSAENFEIGRTYQGLGGLLNAGITFLFVPAYLLISVRKAYRKFKSEGVQINNR